ncbi:MAG: type II toxin-antitoxin system HicA family toxin [Chloroflexi bacterium]|nr:type II toxin-antitoxin system HicA family toxin [Chloroflexota bacterium]
MSYTYRDFRRVLERRGFRLARSRKHETWVLEENGQQVAIVRVSHQYGQEITRSLFYEMLRQAKLTEAEFQELLKDRPVRVGESVVTWETGEDELRVMVDADSFT